MRKVKRLTNSSKPRAGLILQILEEMQREKWLFPFSLQRPLVEWKDKEKDKSADDNSSNYVGVFPSVSEAKLGIRVSSQDYFNLQVPTPVQAHNQNRQASSV
jgi:hypothetical protein